MNTRVEAHRYWWFQGASVEELKAQLEAAGPNARLEVHPNGRQITLLVIANGEASTQDHNSQHINDSHACPPDCGGGG